ncbi:Zinc finger SWIM domain protein [Deinococcus phoenicis]|uniref:Zinc finger SWIM domain protein n=1 Tax=Deinococcus phoenicis TaxID=1476583 RepID=A0A016QM84_9DEIO|nr:SWIM zinc finger family protein [Deinococcus phoenicis]EYB67260.1 Zinc finger SWIM domain protein [Deinococcus phoenicis]
MSPILDQLTADIALALAPDSSSAKAAQKLARPSGWPTLARDGDVLWGECQGSGAHPYLVGVDARSAEIASKCSCPSRKFPCKHALGLLLLHAARVGEWQASSPPPDLARWLGGRVARAEKAAQPPDDQPADPTAQAKAQAKAQAARDRKRSAGLEDLEVWLSDLVREGLQAARARPYGDWDRQAARLVDAQLAGAARQVRQLPELLHEGRADPGGEALTAHLGQLWLLTQGWRVRDTLGAAERADLLTALGAPLDRASLPPAAPQVWQALGSVQEEEGKLNVRRTWLLGEGQPGEEPRLALLLDFAPAGQALPLPLAPQQPFTAAVAYAPSAHAQRAILQGEAAVAATPLPLPGGTLAELQERYAAALALNPWLERIGAFVGPAYLHLDPPQLCDAEGHAVPLSARVEQADLWVMLAQAETQMRTYFGEWDGVTFLPIGAVSTEVGRPGAAGTLHEPGVPA